MLTSEAILRKLEENREEIKRFGVRRIGLFGSYVRGEQREDGIFSGRYINMLEGISHQLNGRLQCKRFYII